MRLSFLLLTTLLLFSCKKEDQAVQLEQPEAKTMLNVSYGSDVRHKMDVYLPAGRHQDSTRVIVLLHGGAWTEGDKSELDVYLPTIRQRLPGYAIINVNYRLASTTGNFFPTQENDLKAAIDFLMQKRAEYKISDQLVLLGSSAGGHMAMLQAYKHASPKIKAVINFFGPSNLVSLYQSTTDLYLLYGLELLLGGTPATSSQMYQQSSPVSFLDAGDPPTLIFHGLNDDLVPVSQSIQLATQLNALGIPHQLITYPGVGHEIWPTQIMNDAFDQIEQFLQTYFP